VLKAMRHHCAASSGGSLSRITTVAVLMVAFLPLQFSLFVSRPAETLPVDGARKRCCTGNFSARL